MKSLKITCVLLLLFVSGCAINHNIPYVNSPVNPSRVRQVPLKVALVVPDASYVQNKTSGNLTETIQAGQYLRNLTRKFISYAFEDVQQVTGKPYPQNVEAVFIPKIDDFEFTAVSVALGFGMKITADVSLKGTLLDKNEMVVWESIVRASKTSRSVVSPVIPMERLKGEAMSDAVGEAFRLMAEEIEMSGEVKNFAASKTSVRPVVRNTAVPVHADSGKSWLGVKINDVTKDVARSLRMRGKGGVVVAEVMANGPAYKGGLQRDDIILEIDRKKVQNSAGMLKIIGAKNSGENVQVKLIRGGRMLTRTVRLGSSSPVVKTPATISVSAPAIEEADLPPYRDDSYAVVIGIDYTGRADIPNLKYASTDAKKVYDVLTDRRYGGIRPENAVLLLNHEATRNRIISALRKLRTWDGYLYVYYSGHGAPVAEGDSMNDAVLVPSDSVIADPDALSETAVRLSYLEDMIQASKAKGVMVALDACFTGGGKSIVAKGGKPIVGMLMTTDLIKTTGSGKVIITSSAGNQQSWEDDSELKSGIFSHYFIKGLKGGAGKDAWVKVDELARYIRTNVPKATHRLKGQEQVPQVIGTGDFAVSRNWERSKLLDAELAKNKLRSAFEKGYITTGQLGKALDAINRKQHSKLLDAFLGDRIGAKTFGELY
jgi:hypothetical protein